MSSRHVHLAGVLAIAVGCLSAEEVEARPASRPPNFVVIFIDDMGYGDFGTFNDGLSSTPTLDALIAESVCLTQQYTASPVCSPARAALLTGRYPPRVGIPNVLFPTSRIGLNANEVTIAELPKAQGYAAACVGK